MGNAALTSASGHLRRFRLVRDMSAYGAASEVPVLRFFRQAAYLGI